MNIRSPFFKYVSQVFLRLRSGGQLVLVIAILLNPSVFNLHAQQSAKPFTQPKEAEDEIPYRIKKKQWTEITGERTEYSSSFRKPDGAYVKYVSREKVNYYKNGKLAPINTELKFSNGGWIADEQQHPFAINANGEISMFVPEINYIFPFGVTNFINQKKAEIPSDIYVHGDTAMFYGIVPGVDKFINTRNNGVKYSYIINNSSSLSSGELEIVESIGLPEGCSISPVKDFSEIIEENNETRIKGHIEVKDKEGNFIMRFGSILVYDAAGKTTVGYYAPKQNLDNNSWTLKLIVDETWLHDPERVFPITIDPLVTGPTSTWSGGFMPSCFAPTYNVDSILVTIPAGITVSNLSVTSHYYADPFFGAWMSDGTMFFSTTCNNSIDFTVASPGGDIAGTGYLQNYNLKARFCVVCRNPVISKLFGYGCILREHLADRDAIRLIYITTRIHFGHSQLTLKDIP